MTTARAGTRARHSALLELMHGGVTSVEDLADRLAVSASTVRRDLDRLRDAGRVARTYGGAIVAPAYGGFQEVSVAESARRGRAAKAAIARAALDLVPREGRVFLDAGTTCGALAGLLASRDATAEPAPPTPLTVVTRGLETALTLADADHVVVELVGGRLRRLSHGLVGPLSSLALDRMSFDVAFLGADVVDPDRGVGEPSLEETAVKEQVAARSARTVVLADAGKLSASPAPAWTSLVDPWTLVTDADEARAPQLTARCAAAGVTLVRAETV